MLETTRSDKVKPSINTRPAAENNNKGWIDKN
jgi:hypothetical protein